MALSENRYAKDSAPLWFMSNEKLFKETQLIHTSTDQRKFHNNLDRGSDGQVKYFLSVTTFPETSNTSTQYKSDNMSMGSVVPVSVSSSIPVSVTDKPNKEERIKWNRSEIIVKTGKDLIKGDDQEYENLKEETLEDKDHLLIKGERKTEDGEESILELRQEEPEEKVAIFTFDASTPDQNVHTIDDGDCAGGHSLSDIEQISLASDQVVVLALHAGLQEIEELPKVPKNITFCKEEMMYTSLRDLIQCDTDHFKNYFMRECGSSVRGRENHDCNDDLANSGTELDALKELYAKSDLCPKERDSENECKCACTVM